MTTRATGEAGSARPFACHRAEGQKPLPGPRIGRLARRIHNADQSLRDCRLQKRTARPCRWRAPGREHRGGGRKALAFALFVTPEMDAGTRPRWAVAAAAGRTSGAERLTSAAGVSFLLASVIGFYKARAGLSFA